MMRPAFTPATAFGSCLCSLAAIVATIRYGWMAGALISFAIYVIGVVVFAVAQLVGSAVGNAIAGLAERRRSR